MADITYPSFIGPSERPELDRAMVRIAKAVMDKRADFLFGAGMSVASGVPSGGRLAAQLLELFFPDGSLDAARREKLAASLPFECIVQAIEQSAGKGREDLTDHLRQVFLSPSLEINQAHRDFLSICFWDGRPMLNRVFTTNFDPLLEKAFGARCTRITEDNTQTIPDVQRAGKMPILYLHGTLESAKYQITEADVYDQQFRALHHMFRTALNEADAFVFVGYSMSDPDFRSLYMAYREEIDLRRKANKKVYVVAPAKDVHTYVLGKGIWESRFAVWLPLDAQGFFAGLKSILEEKVTKETKEKIMKKYNLKDEAAFMDKVRQTADILRIEETDAIQFLFEARSRTGAKE
jgi:hypothetical protein